MQSNKRTELSDVQVEETSEPTKPRLHQPLYCEVAGSGVTSDTPSAMSFVYCFDGELKDELPVGCFTAFSA